MTVAGLGTITGEWDLRANVRAYLGGVALQGKRVLEIGTASGFLCFAMERMGAEVISYDLSPAMFQLGLKAFPATILGGLDAVLGSGVGGLLIGITENLAGGYLGSGMKEVAGFLMIILVLMIRPFGIFGERDIERV